MSRFATFTYAAEETAEQRADLFRHAGAARFANNQGLRFVKEALSFNQQNPHNRIKVPWSGFDLINRFNKWKLSEAAGADVDGQCGLAWRHEVSQQVFEESLVNLGQALKRYSESKRTKGARKVGFPKFKKKSSAKRSFRFRNRKNNIAVGIGCIKLPFFGELKVKESTRQLRRILGKPETPRGKIIFVTICLSGDRWLIRVNVEASELHTAAQTALDNVDEWVGIDCGLKHFIVAANRHGVELIRVDAPKTLIRCMRPLKRLSKRFSRTSKTSKNHQKIRRKLNRYHQKIAHKRLHFIHEHSSRLAKTQGRLVVEDLNIMGMMQNRCLSGAIADVGWGLFKKQVTYKASWYGGKVVEAPRFFASTKQCLKCDLKHTELKLSDRIFHCPSCGHTADRDAHAAANLAKWAYLNISTSVAVQHTET